MDTLLAMMMAERARGREPMVFDWQRAARRIRETGARDARAGLRGDWEWTGGLILTDGRPLSREESYTYLASIWAVPELEIDGQVEECYRMRGQTPGWDANTMWPEEALRELRGETPEVE